VTASTCHDRSLTGRQTGGERLDDAFGDASGFCEIDLLVDVVELSGALSGDLDFDVYPYCVVIFSRRMSMMSSRNRGLPRCLVPAFISRMNFATDSA